MSAEDWCNGAGGCRGRYAQCSIAGGALAAQLCDNVSLRSCTDKPLPLLLLLVVVVLLLLLPQLLLLLLLPLPLPLPLPPLLLLPLPLLPQLPPCYLPSSAFLSS